MPRYLVSIQETVQKYARILAEVLHVDVEVVDENLYRVAGTGLFAGHVGADMSAEGYVYRHVIAAKKPQVIDSPGADPLCRQCPARYTCRERFEISAPILMGEKVIGVIGLVSTDLPQKNLLAENLPVYLEFLTQISQFIAARAAEEEESQENQALLGALTAVTRHIEQGVLLLAENGTITSISEVAQKQLRLGEECLGRKAVLTYTGDQLGEGREYILQIDRKKWTIMGSTTQTENGGKYSRLLMLQPLGQMKSKLYEMTSTVHTLTADNIVGSGPKTTALREEIRKVSRSISTVLITGESGTGKEMVATAIWKNSSRASKPFVALNCAAIPEALLESELFGYVKGAFTGADPNGRMGKFELANGGVIFLDEIGDMPLFLQAKLLRVLQQRTITRIGSNQVVPVDVRVIAATNRDILQMIGEKKFREDLYYRLNVIPLNIAPLRERPEEVEELTLHFVHHYCELFDKHFERLSPAVLERLRAWPWKGNVRELENTVEFMVNMMEDGLLDESTLPAEFHTAPPAVAGVSGVLPLRELEKRELEKALNLCGRTTSGKKAAARALGIGVATLYRKMDEYKISK